MRAVRSKSRWDRVVADLCAVVAHLLVVSVVFATGECRQVCSAGEPNAKVPPAQEIEILDPGVDPLGNPAVQLKESKAGDTEVDIPPAILVHKYYYSGDRSFQAQMLPGGPVVVVANHPKTGERCYIPVQMIPGAPRVHYTAKGIEYDYGTRGITVHFGLFGGPTVKYRNSEKLSRHVGNALHLQQLRQRADQTVALAKKAGAQSKAVVTGALVEAKETAMLVTLPAQNVAQLLPFGKVLLGGDLTKRLAEKGKQHQQQAALKKAQVSQ